MPKERREYGIPIDMTPMIDCVFQLMIFFIVTFKLDADQINENIELAKSPNGPPIERKMPGTLIIEVDSRGIVSISRVVLSDKMLYSVVRQMANRIGANNVEILIRADRDTQHAYVRRVMDRCTDAGVWRLKFAALKKKAR